jgi:ribosomal protein S18 acetylase RimI-like enzyme
MYAAARALSLTVRRAVAADIAAITRLVNRAYRVEEFFVDGDRTDEAEIATLFRDGIFLVLDRNDGELGASVYVETAAPRGYVGLLSVDPALQGIGLGRRLIGVAEALCTAVGCTAVDLQVVNLRAELPPWYRSLGYRECGTKPFPSPSDRALKKPCHFIQMTKSL